MPTPALTIVLPPKSHCRIGASRSRRGAAGTPSPATVARAALTAGASSTRTAARDCPPAGAVGASLTAANGAGSTADAGAGSTADADGKPTRFAAWGAAVDARIGAASAWGASGCAVAAATGVSTRLRNARSRAAGAAFGR